MLHIVSDLEMILSTQEGVCMCTVHTDCSGLQGDLSLHGSWDPQELWKPVPQGGSPRDGGAEGRPEELVYHAPCFVYTFLKTQVNLVCMFCESFS